MLNKYTVIFFALWMVAACSSDTAENKEETSEDITHEIAEKAVAAIQDPLDKARNAAEKQEQHSQQVDEQQQMMDK